MEEISNAKNHLFLGMTELVEIRKVKAVSPSPFYDGKYHPPLIEQPELLD
jgi:hypothetical protein